MIRAKKSLLLFSLFVAVWVFVPAWYSHAASVKTETETSSSSDKDSSQYKSEHTESVRSSVPGVEEKKTEKTKTTTTTEKPGVEKKQTTTTTTETNKLVEPVQSSSARREWACGLSVCGGRNAVRLIAATNRNLEGTVSLECSSNRAPLSR